MLYPFVNTDGMSKMQKCAQYTCMDFNSTVCMGLNTKVALEMNCHLTREQYMSQKPYHMSVTQWYHL